MKSHGERPYYPGLSAVAFGLMCTSMTAVIAAGADVSRREQGNLVLENIPEIPEALAERMRQYQNVRSAYLQGWGPAGDGMLISTRFAETAQLHWIDKPGGARRQLTFYDEPVHSAAICPDPLRPVFIFARDVGGDENHQLHQFDLADGRTRMFTDGQSRYGAVLWSNRGDRFCYYRTPPGAADWYIHVARGDDPGSAERILAEPGTWVPVDFSPDDRKLLVKRFVSANESYLHVLSLDTGELKQVNPSDEKIACGNAVFSADGNGLYLVSDENEAFSKLRRYDLESGRQEVITADIPWNVEELAVSRRRDRIAFTTNEDGVSKLYLLDPMSGRREPVRDVPMGQVYGLTFHPDGLSLAMVINTSTSPGDIYVLSLDSRQIERWTFSEIGGLNPERFVVPTLVHYDTFDMTDGKPRQIPAFYYRPHFRTGPCPVLVYIHGGPEGQFRPYFLPHVQYWVNELGIAVLAPNVRGSEGYGKEYLTLDNGYLREDSVRDIGALLGWIEQQPELDASRVAVYGGSYGGYMVLASMVHYNDRLRAGISMVGISHFVTFLENTTPYRQDLRRVEYGDERDTKMREFLDRISPLTNAGKISSPLFIAQGLNDPRVPATEAGQIVARVRQNNTPVWYLLARDEGHGFRKKVNRDYFIQAMALFLQEFLLN